MMVSLVPLTPQNRPAYAALQVAQGQQDLIAANPPWLDQAATEHGALTFGVAAGDTAAGLVSLIDPRAIPPHGNHSGYRPRCGFLWRLMVDAQFQRKGIARAALDLVEEHMQDAGLSGVSTSTMDKCPGNALPLYQAAGYRPTGARLHDEIELVKYFVEDADA